MYPSAWRGGWWTALCLGAALAIALGLLLAPGLARPQLMMFDEGLHAVVARNLLDHPFRLTLYDAPLIQPRRPDRMLASEWWHSPPLALWQMGLSLSLFGVNALAIRLPSALLHIGAALVTYRIGRRLFGTTVGIGAAVLQAFSPLLLASVLGQQQSGHLDIALLFWTEVGLLALIEGARRGRSTWFAAAGVGLGLAFLAGDFEALALPGTLIGLWIVTRLPLDSVGSYGVRFRDAVLLLAVAAVPIAVWIGHGRATGGELFSQEVAHWIPSNLPRISAPSALVHRLGGYLPGLAVPALLALGLATVRAARHSSDLILAMWVWAGLIPLSLLTGATPALAVVAVPALAIGLVHALDLGVRTLARAPRLQPLGVTLALVMVGAATAAYALDGWRAARRERPDLALLRASRLRTQLPDDAVFILDQSDTTGVYLSLMFWTGRPVYSLWRLQHHQPLLSPAIAGDLVRRGRRAPYLLASAPAPDAPPASASAEPYRAYAIGPTPTGAPTLQRMDAPAPVGWAHYGGDAAGTKYSPLADIDRTNVGRLQLAWIWRTGERPWQSETRRSRPGLFEATPLMFGDTLYLTTPYHRVVALDAETGAQLWSFDPGAYRLGQPLGSYGFVHRGLAAWSDGSRRRLFHASRGRLYALDATTGHPVREFGGTGAVSLVEALGWSGNPNHIENTSPPIVYGDLVIVGSSIADEMTYRGDPPGAVIAFEARSGRRAWIFNTVPRPNEPGHDTWTRGTEGAGHVNVWAPMTVDSVRGLLYLPVGAASNDWYGGRRPGANLFSESLVCLDARTGKRRWHFQAVHHGLWDYDLAGPPVLATVRRGDRVQDVVAAAGKTGFVYVFDRVTGAPVWPIEERSVPPSDVPGEVAHPTQPFPTRPLPFVRQGFSENDIIDFTPRLRDSVRNALKGVRFGPMFTPPSVTGAVIMPGWLGGAGWGGAAYDPESQVLFVKGNNQPIVVRLRSPGRPTDTIDAELIGERLGDTGSARSVQRLPSSLPINKPPYGTVTAIDLATGEHRWQATVGTRPDLEKHPSLRGVKLPPLGSVGTPGPLVTRGGLLFISSGSTSLHALDTETGRELWQAPVGGKGYSNPMTYRTRNGRQFIIAASSRGAEGTLLAFALPWR